MNQLINFLSHGNISEREEWLTIGRELEVQDALRTPDEVRRSRSDSAVYLFYRLEHSGRWICAVAKRLNDRGFLITAYLTDAIKEGERVWSR